MVVTVPNDFARNTENNENILIEIKGLNLLRKILTAKVKITVMFSRNYCES